MRRRKGFLHFFIIIGVTVVVINLAAVIHNGAQEYPRHLEKRKYTDNVQTTVRNWIEPLMTSTVNKTNNNVSGKLLIVSYMRSGSSFVGEVMQSSRDVFYLFEPLHKVVFAAKEQKELVYLNGTKRKYEDPIGVAVDVLRALLQCDMHKVPINIWGERFAMNKTFSATKLWKCVKKKTDWFFEGNVLNHPERMKECVQMIEDRCRNAKHIVFKNVRIPMYLLGPIMKDMPELKLLHLIRDPRATVRSQIRVTQMKNDSSLIDGATGLCNRIYDDVVTKEELERKFPRRIHTLYFEDAAQNILYHAKHLYKFAGIELHPDVKKRIIHLTKADKYKECEDYTFCTLSYNSTLQSQEWRDKITFKIATTVDSACRQLYARLGFRPVPDQTSLRDRKFKLRIPISSPRRYRMEY